MTYTNKDITDLLADTLRTRFCELDLPRIEEAIEETLQVILDNKLLVEKYIGDPTKSFKRMKVSNLVHGVGWVDVEVTANNKAAYEVWRHMLRRACADELKKRKPSYSITTVSEEWKTFSNFLKFYTGEYKEGCHLDKDILVADNKVYSAATCCFVPPAINGLVVNLVNDRKGAYYDKNKNKYRSSISIEGKTKNLGNYDSVEDAQKAYLSAKKIHVINVAKEYLDRGLISARVSEALISKVSNW